VSKRATDWRSAEAANCPGPFALHEKLAAHSGNTGLVVVDQRDEQLDGGIIH